MEYAGFWRRLVASLIDELIIGVTASAISGVAVFALVTRGGAATFDIVGSTLLYAVVGSVIAIVYFTFLEGRYGVTAGKRLMNCKLVHYDQPNRDGIGYARALARFIVAVVLRGLFNIGFLWALIDPRRRALQDRAFGTVVVHDRSGRFPTFDPAALKNVDVHRVWFAIALAVSVIAAFVNYVVTRAPAT